MKSNFHSFTNIKKELERIKMKLSAGRKKTKQPPTKK
uniref:Uncharacterized protein n=1 Tax=Anguilla anguilla TaxID=7936 RepID=A0A0E9UAD3_ANGAN